MFTTICTVIGIVVGFAAGIIFEKKWGATADKVVTDIQSPKS